MVKTTICDIPVIVSGSGKLLVLLHGFMSSKQAFIRQIQFFEKYYKVVALDLYGFGENVQNGKAYTLDDYSNDVLNLINYLGYRKVDVIAHSFGCRVALNIMTKSDVIDKAVLCGPAGLKPKRKLGYILKTFVYKRIRPLISKKKAEKLFFSKDYNLLDDVMKQTFKRVVNVYFDHKLKTINSKIFVVIGEKDDQTPVYIAKRFYKNVSNCSYYIMKGCSHFCFAQNYKQFNYIAREFLL